MLGELLDPQSERLVYEHWRPHWLQARALVFIIFRTADSIPREVLQRWDREQRDWLRQRGPSARGHWWAVHFHAAPKDRVEFRKTFYRSREEYLDTCHGRCLLRIENEITSRTSARVRMPSRRIVWEPLAARWIILEPRSRGLAIVGPLLRAGARAACPSIRIEPSTSLVYEASAVIQGLRARLNHQKPRERG